MMKHVLRYCCLALAACLGSFAFASDAEFRTVAAMRYVVHDLGGFGDSVAKFKAEQTFVLSSEDERLCSQSGALVRDSHGFLQASASEVAKGTTGSTVSLYLS